MIDSENLILKINGKEMIIWLVGLSGAGKTTIGREIYKLWKPIAPNTVMLDGDDIRRILGRESEPSDFTQEGRYNLALQYVKIITWLDAQDINVLCCTLSNYDDIHEQNRQKFSNYFHVFVDAPIDLVKKRDPKGIYRRFEIGEEKNVVGIDVPFNSPEKPDFVVRFEKETETPEDLARRIIEASGV